MEVETPLELQLHYRNQKQQPVATDFSMPMDADMDEESLAIFAAVEKKHFAAKEIGAELKMSANFPCAIIDNAAAAMITAQPEPGPLPAESPTANSAAASDSSSCITVPPPPTAASAASVSDSNSNPMTSAQSAESDIDNLSINRSVCPLPVSGSSELSESDSDSVRQDLFPAAGKSVG